MTIASVVAALFLFFSLVVSALAGQGTWKTTPEQDAVLTPFLAEQQAKFKGNAPKDTQDWVQGLVNRQVESINRARAMRDAQEKIKAQKAVPTPK